MWKDVHGKRFPFFLFLRKNCSHGEKGQKKSRIKAFVRTSLVGQWLGIHLLMQDTWVRSLVPPTWCVGTKPMGHNCWSPRALETTPREATAMRSPCITTRVQPPLIATRESLLTATKTQHHHFQKSVCENSAKTFQFMTLSPHRYTHAYSQHTWRVPSSTSPFWNGYNKLADRAARYWCFSLLQPSQIISIFKVTRSPGDLLWPFMFIREVALVLIHPEIFFFFFFLFWKSNELGKQPQYGRGKMNVMTCQVEMQCAHWNGREIPRAILLTPWPTENDLLTGCWFLKHTRGSFLARQRIIHHQRREKTAGPRSCWPFAYAESKQ